MRIVATIEARMTSTRLPGKVLLPAGGKPMLSHLIDRLKAVPSLQEIVIATTINAADQPLADLAASAGIACFRGSENDVMERVIGAAESVQADVVVEITGDCPIIDPQIVEQIIRIFVANQADYVSNAHVRSYPDGMDVQVFSLDTLKRSAGMTQSKLDREHVTLHIRQHPELFSHLHVLAPPEIHWPELGLTLDEPKDYELITQVIEALQVDKPLFSCLDAVRLMRSQPELLNINQTVIRKGNT
jgi:spore coat polysaccharide biosynthesis protein SpsF